MKRNTLWSFTYGYRKPYVIAFMLTILATGCAYVSPLLIRFTIDHIVDKQPTNWIYLQQLFVETGLWFIAFVLVVFAMIEGILNYARSYLVQKSAESIVKNLRETSYNHLQHLQASFHNKSETGDLIQRSTSDIETIRRFLAMHVPEIARSLIMVILVVPIMLSIDLTMTAVAIATIPVIFLFAVIFFRKMQRAFQITDEAEAAMTTVIQENLTAARVVRAFGRKNYEMEKFAIRNEDYRNRHYRVIHLIAWYWTISDFVCLLQMAAVLIFGGIWVISGHITLGTLVVFVTYEAMLLWPVRHMGRILADFGKTTVAVKRVAEILDEQVEEENPKTEEVPLQGDIEFQNVSFAYHPGTPVLKNISFRIKKGQTVALLGATGAGKSTVVKLLLRLYEYQDGKITADGRDIRDIHKKSLRKQLGIVLQNPFLYSKTIYENLLWGNLDASKEQVYRAAETAAIHHTIQGFESGYDTKIGERGVTLSGGQKQRTAIARTLLRETPILIFDDSFSAVDTDTENSILQSLRSSELKTKTTLIIAHRLSTVKHADWIVFLEHGKIVQQGTHEDLLRSQGNYKRIWEMQCQFDKNIELDEREHAHPPPLV